MLPRPLRLLPLSLLASLALGAPAAAEDLAVRYTVEAKPLRELHPDSYLRFELHGNASCSSLLHVEEMHAGDPGLSLEEVRRWTLHRFDDDSDSSDSDRRHRRFRSVRIRAARIQAVLDTPAVGSPLYLIVIGHGIEAIGSDCQVQPGAGMRGPRGPAGPQGPPGPDGGGSIEAGLPGPAGPQGPQGPMGPMGPMGVPGPAGASGADGARGPVGPMGMMGMPGAAGADGARGAEGPVGATGPQGPQGPQGASGPDPFAFYQHAMSDAESSTMVWTTYQQKLRLTTADLPAGSYRIGYSMELTNSHRAGTSDFRVQVDGAMVLTEASSSAPAVANRYSTYGGFAIVPLGAGVHDIDVDFKANAANTARIRRVRIEIYPVP